MTIQSSVLIALLFLPQAPQPESPWTTADLGWLSGTWQTEGETRIEEHWTEPAGGLMLGLNRTIRSGRAMAFEFLRIETRPNGLFYVAQPDGREGTDFQLVELTPSRATFENMEHDYPKRIVYRRNHDGTLTAEISGTRDQPVGRFHFRPDG